MSWSLKFIAETYLHGLMNGEVFGTGFKDRIGPLYLE